MNPSTLFAFMCEPHGDGREILLLCRSLRRYGGSLAASPVFALLPASVEGFESLVPALKAEGAHIERCHIPPEALNFPLAAKVFAAARAEQIAENEGRQLVWMDPDTLVLQEPGGLLLPDTVSLGCRPVMLTLVSSLFDKPLPPFWKTVYQHCAVNLEKVFPVETTVDRQRIHAHFNAGLLAVRPERGLLRLWREKFESLYLSSGMADFYAQNRLYKIFIHQAVLAGCILHLLSKDEIRLFSQKYNYPLHLAKELPPDQRIESLAELVTCRYDEWETLAEASWTAEMTIQPAMKAWLKDQISRR